MTSYESNNERSREGCVIVVFLWILTEINRFNYKFCEFHPSTFDSKLKVSNSKVFIWNEKKPPAFVVNNGQECAFLVTYTPSTHSYWSFYIIYKSCFFVFYMDVLFRIKLTCTRLGGGGGKWIAIGSDWRGVVVGEADYCFG